MVEGSAGHTDNQGGEPLRVPVSVSHNWLYHPNMNGYGIVSCRRCGKFASYLISGYKPEPPKEPCYGK